MKHFFRFPEHEEIHEVIGYGGDVDYSTDEDEPDRWEIQLQSIRDRDYNSFLHQGALKYLEGDYQGDGANSQTYSYGMLQCMWCNIWVFVINATVYLLVRYSLYLFLLKTNQLERDCSNE